MFKNYLVTALRNIRKNKLTSLITIIGFSIGIAGALLIFLYAQYEFSFNKFLAGHERIYRLLVRATSVEGGEFFSPNVDARVKNSLLSRNQGIENLTQVNLTDALLGYDNHFFFESGEIFITDSSFMKVFSYPLVSGDPGTALERPMSVVLTAEKARKYFGSENPIGKTLSFSAYDLGDKIYYFTVTGVLAPLPVNSTLRFSFLMNCSMDKYIGDVYQYYNSEHGTDANPKDNPLLASFYVKLKSNAFLFGFGRSLRRVLDGTPANAMLYVYKSFQLTYEALDNVYLFSHFDTPTEKRGNFLFILLLAGLGIIVIAIACINVVNLTTARAMTRAKEIGIRKALGASRTELRLQCIVESVCLSFISLWISLVIVELLLPIFGLLLKRDLTIDYLSNPAYLAAVIGVTFAVGLLSGLYPAVYLSSFSVVHTLKGQRTPSSRRFREAMVVVQFVFSIGMFVASGAVLKEFKAARTADTGQDSKDLIVARLNIQQVETKFPDLKKAIASVPGVVGVTATSLAAWKDGDYAKDLPLTIEGKVRYCDILVVDPDYLKVLGVSLAQGKQFDPDYENIGMNQLIVNEAAARQFGFHVDGFLWPDPVKGKVIGIAKDFNYLFPSRRVKPLILVPNSPLLINNAFGPSPIHYDYMLVKLQGGDQTRILESIKRTWDIFNPGYAFEYRYVDEAMRGQLDDYYHSFEAILDISTILSFLLSGLGLFGLASFEVERRTKEVGVRKALGATSMQIVLHFLFGFSRLIALANIIAWPLTFALIRVVFALIQYPRVIPIGPLVFLEAGLASMAVMVATVGAQTLRAARANPANTIRYE